MKLCIVTLRDRKTGATRTIELAVKKDEKGYAIRKMIRAMAPGAIFVKMTMLR